MYLSTQVGNITPFLTRKEAYYFIATGAKIEFVNNSGICETTPGVKQYSGYLTVGDNMNMWFWFFEARNSPITAPLATWFNGSSRGL